MVFRVKLFRGIRGIRGTASNFFLYQVDLLQPWKAHDTLKAIIFLEFHQICKPPNNL